MFPPLTVLRSLVRSKVHPSKPCDASIVHADNSSFKTKELSERLLKRLTALHYSLCETGYKIFLLFVCSFFLPGGSLSLCMAMTIQTRREDTVFLHLKRPSACARSIDSMIMPLSVRPILPVRGVFYLTPCAVVLKCKFEYSRLHYQLFRSSDGLHI